MRKIGRIGILALAFGFWLTGAPGLAGAADVPSRTFNAPIDRVWAVTESVLKSLGWDIDKSDRAVGWILTESRGVEFKDYAVYGKGLRHKVRVALKAAGEGRTTVSIERELYTEERILWMTERKPVTPTEQTVETGILDAIQKAL
jgi:hypothetical protein